MDPEVSVINVKFKEEEKTLLQGYMKSHLFSVNPIFSMQTFLNLHMQIIIFRKTLLCKNELLYLFIYPCTIQVSTFVFNLLRLWPALLPRHRYLAARRTWRSRLTPSSCTLGWTGRKRCKINVKVNCALLTRTHWTALLWSPLRTQTFCPFSAFQMWIRPSVEPLMKGDN